MNRLFFCTDLHGSEVCFRKFLSASKVYKADVVIMGGDCNRDNASNLPPCTTISSPLRPRMLVARSRHAGGLNAVYCDGHVAFVSNHIDINTWRALSTTKGGEVINANQ